MSQTLDAKTPPKECSKPKSNPATEAPKSGPNSPMPSPTMKQPPKPKALRAQF